MARHRAKGEGSLRKRSDGRWEGRYTAGRDDTTGKLLYRSVFAKTQAECKKKLREAIESYEQEAVEQAKGSALIRGQYTVGEWLTTWFELYSIPNIRESTQDYYNNYIYNHIIPAIGNVPLEQLNGLRLQQFYQELKKNGRVRQEKGKGQELSARTVRGIHTLLHGALDQALKEGLISKNPTNDCKAPKHERKEMKVLQPEQVKTYLQAAANRNVLPMFYLELSSGLRRGELLALLWSDLDVKNRMISVSKSVQGIHGELKVTQPKTVNSIRKVMIPQQAVDLLIQEHELHPDNPYMFPSPVTENMYHPDAVGRIHQKLLKDAGIKHIRFHDLRHTFATIALQNGVDIKTVSGMLGHYSSGFTLDTYTHITQKMQEEAAEKMGNFMKMEL